jgi:virulence-associated protein VagC
LIGQEVKIKKLSDSGIPVTGIREIMTRIRDLIESADVEKADEEMKLLEKEISRQSLNLSEGTRQVESPEKEVDMETAGDVVVIDPEEAKSKLFSLVADIRNEMKIRSNQGRSTGEIKKDIETVQNLVIRKEYVKAYSVAVECLDRITK